jgi:hypothetical protein
MIRCLSSDWRDVQNRCLGRLSRGEPAQGSHDEEKERVRNVGATKYVCFGIGLSFCSRCAGGSTELLCYNNPLGVA